MMRQLRNPVGLTGQEAKDDCNCRKLVLFLVLSSCVKLGQRNWKASQARRKISQRHIQDPSCRSSEW